jgi:Arc/MetJ family transcription regulator
MVMRKTTVVIDEQLLEQAIEAAGARSKKEAIEAGLKTLIKQRNREALRTELGTFEIDMSLNDLERLRDDE